jgi:hypothetical protein
MATINTDNYTVGQIDLYFEASVNHASLLEASAAVSAGKGGAFRTTGRSLGNIVTSEITSDTTFLEHYISDCGRRKKDKVAANSINVSIPFTFDEMNENNLKRFFLASSLGDGKLAIMEEPITEGSAQLVFRTNVGQDLTMFLPKVQIRPDGALSISEEEWWTGPLVLEILHYDTDHWASKSFGLLLASTIDCS